MLGGNSSWKLTRVARRSERALACWLKRQPRRERRSSPIPRAMSLLPSANNAVVAAAASRVEVTGPWRGSGCAGVGDGKTGGGGLKPPEIVGCGGQGVVIFYSLARPSARRRSARRTDGVKKSRTRLSCGRATVAFAKRPHSSASRPFRGRILKGNKRGDSTRSQRGQGMSGLCAKRSCGYIRRLFQILRPMASRSENRRRMWTEGHSNWGEDIVRLFFDWAT
jgi:hypothetical protein